MIMTIIKFIFRLISSYIHDKTPKFLSFFLWVKKNIWAMRLQPFSILFHSVFGLLFWNFYFSCRSERHVFKFWLLLNKASYLIRGCSLIWNKGIIPPEVPRLNEMMYRKEPDTQYSVNSSSLQVSNHSLILQWACGQKHWSFLLRVSSLSYQELIRQPQYEEIPIWEPKRKVIDYLGLVGYVKIFL